MNTEQFIQAYNASRNGTDNFHFNPLYRTFIYSDGVKECAEAGCYWLLDILGTELPGFIRERTAGMCVVVVTVKDGKAQIVAEAYDGDPTPYKRSVDFTDMPEGEWMFYVSDEGGRFPCILPSEY